MDIYEALIAENERLRQSLADLLIQEAQSRWNWKQVTANYTATELDFAIDIAGAYTVTLPLAATCAGRVYLFTKTTGIGNAVVKPTKGDTINGASQVVLSGTLAYPTLMVVSNGVATWVRFPQVVGAMQLMVEADDFVWEDDDLVYVEV